MFHSDILSIHPYVPGNPIAEVARELGIDPSTIIKLASNENPLGPSPKAIEAIKNSADQVHMYPGDREWELRQKVADYAGVKRENIIFGAGSSEIIGMIATAFLRDKQVGVTSKGSFIMYKLCTAYAGGKLIEVPLTDSYHHDLESMVTAAKEHEAQVIFLDNPMNPPGTMLTKNQIDIFLQSIPKDIIVVLDEAYFEYACEHQSYPKSVQYILDNAPNVIILRSFSKAFGLAGLRFGYGIAHPDIIQYLERVRAPFNVSLPAMEAAFAALDDQEHIQKSVRVNAQGMAFFEKKFSEMGFSYIPSVANFITVDVQKDAAGVCASMQKQGVIVRPIAGYGFPAHIRISIGTEEQNERCVEVLKMLI